MRSYIVCIGEKKMSEEKEKLDQDVIQLSQGELSQEEVAKLINKVLQEGSQETKFILELKTWNRPGSSFKDFGELKILYGEIEEVLLDHIYNYPTTNEYVYAIIPKTRSVVLLHESEDDYEGKLQKHQTLYVFAYPDGWKSLDLY